MPNYYPVYLKLAGRRCVVFGGGAVAEGKLSKLIESGARVTVVSPRVTAVINDLALTGTIQWTARVYQDGDLEGAHLAIAATDDRQVNQQIAQEAELRGVILNVVDDPDLCGFIAPSVVERGPVTLAISTGGASPALARKLREALTDTPAMEWADLAPVLSRAQQGIETPGRNGGRPAVAMLLDTIAVANDPGWPGRGGVRDTPLRPLGPDHSVALSGPGAMPATTVLSRRCGPRGSTCGYATGLTVGISDETPARNYPATPNIP